jgi:ActR/RegA family two-component response regulator
MHEHINILSVDDDERFRNGLRRVFHLRRARPHMDLVEARSGREAMEALAKERVDCVLLDYHMPGGSGLDWLRRILNAHPDMAVVMVTGSGDEATAVEAMKRGAMDYLVKGAIREDTICRAIVNAVEKCDLHRRLKEQGEKLLEAERQRVMIESLGAACHHLGQPTTVILGYLGLLRRYVETADGRAVVEECCKAANTLADIIRQLQRFSCYRTEPYLTEEPPAGDTPGRNIICLADHEPACAAAG